MSRLTTPIQIRFSDVDMARHVHNAAYLHYFESGRMAFLERFIPKEHDWSIEGLILARNEIDYVTPVHLHDALHVETWCERIGNKSFDLAYEIFSTTDKVRIVHAKGRSVMVAYSYADQTSIEIPAIWHNALNGSINIK